MFKKILILTPFPPNGCGGAETFVKELIKEASKTNWVTLCTLKKRKKAWKGTGVLNLFSVFPILTLKTLLLTFQIRIDILHAQGLISGLIAVLLKKVFKIKAYITLLALYDFESRKLHRFAKFVLSNCDVVFVEGINGKNNIRGLCEDSKIRIFYHWIDQQIFKPPKQRDKEKIRVLFVGRPIPEKGKHIVQEAEKLLDNKYEFKYIENVTYEELPKNYQWADIVVVPSLYPEGFTRVVAEGASCGCAIITSNKGSLPEQVKDFGISINPEGKELADCLKSIDINLYQKKSLDYATKNFTSKNFEAFENEYNN